MQEKYENDGSLTIKIPKDVYKRQPEMYGDIKKDFINSLVSIGNKMRCV